MVRAGAGSGSASTPTKAASASEAAEPDGHDTPGKTRISFLTLGRASGVFRGYAKEPPGAWARPGVLVTVNAAACYSPTSSRVQYHRRARP